MGQALQVGDTLANAAAAACALSAAALKPHNLPLLVMVEVEPWAVTRFYAAASLMKGVRVILIDDRGPKAMR